MMRAKKLTKQQEKMILEMYSKGLSFREIAREMQKQGISITKSSVQRYFDSMRKNAMKENIYSKALYELLDKHIKDDEVKRQAQLLHLSAMLEFYNQLRYMYKEEEE